MFGKECVCIKTGLMMSEIRPSAQEQTGQGCTHYSLVPKTKTRPRSKGRGTLVPFGGRPVPLTPSLVAIAIKGHDRHSPCNGDQYRSIPSLYQVKVVPGTFSPSLRSCGTKEIFASVWGRQCVPLFADGLISQFAERRGLS
jgi:hypothetical protein